MCGSRRSAPELTISGINVDDRLQASLYERRPTRVRHQSDARLGRAADSSRSAAALRSFDTQAALLGDTGRSPLT